MQPRLGEIATADSAVSASQAARGDTEGRNGKTLLDFAVYGCTSPESQGPPGKVVCACRNGCGPDAPRVLAKGDAWGLVISRCMLLFSAKAVASAASCLDLQGSQPIVSKKPHAHEKKHKWQGRLIKKEGVGGSMLTSGEEEAGDAWRNRFLGVSRRRESAPEDGRTRLTPEHRGKRLLAVI